MRIGNKKELKRIAEEKSGHLDYKDFFKMYNYCTKDPYSFMILDLLLLYNLKKTSMNQYIQSTNSLEHSSLEHNFEKIFINNDS